MYIGTFENEDALNLFLHLQRNENADERILHDASREKEMGAI